MRTPTSMRSSGASVGAAIDLGARERWREVRRARLGGRRAPGQATPYAARTSSASFGATCVQVADDAEVGEVEDRRVRVLVDRDDRAGVLHAHLVLDRAGDAERDVELRRDRLARLADLGRVRVPARVDDGSRRGDRAAERRGELLGQLEALGRAEAAPAGDDHVGILDRRPARLLLRLLDHPRRRREVPRASRRQSWTVAVPPVSTARTHPTGRARSAARSSSRP